MAAGATYEPIATTTLGSSSTDVEFNTISSAYTDLVLVIDGKDTTSTYSPYIQFNGDTTTNYSITNLYGDGSSAASNRSSSTSTPYLGSLGTSRGNMIIQIQNYANTTTYKTALVRINAANFRTYASVVLWRKSPEAINRVNIKMEASGNFATGSTFTLYGIAAA
jgi:hypothetical protein